jgi:hypothetical protein
MLAVLAYHPSFLLLPTPVDSPMGVEPPTEVLKAISTNEDSNRVAMEELKVVRLVTITGAQHRTELTTAEPTTAEQLQTKGLTPTR